MSAKTDFFFLEGILGFSIFLKDFDEITNLNLLSSIFPNSFLAKPKGQLEKEERKENGAIFETM